MSNTDKRATTKHVVNEIISNFVAKDSADEIILDALATQNVDPAELFKKFMERSVKTD